mmetsp:Transcript_61014/g.163674  ORF Transcript_61014/g.163674 Transcript_61014/m.163674 type:complete len:447 (-) Transcript_61014:692-2032(-)
MTILTTGDTSQAGGCSYLPTTCPQPEITSETQKGAMSADSWRHLAGKRSLAIFVIQLPHKARTASPKPLVPVETRCTRMDSRRVAADLITARLASELSATGGAMTALAAYSSVNLGHLATQSVYVVCERQHVQRFDSRSYSHDTEQELINVHTVGVIRINGMEQSDRLMTVQTNLEEKGLHCRNLQKLLKLLKRQAPVRIIVTLQKKLPQLLDLRRHFDFPQLQQLLAVRLRGRHDVLHEDSGHNVENSHSDKNNVGNDYSQCPRCVIPDRPYDAHAPRLQSEDLEQAEHSFRHAAEEVSDGVGFSGWGSRALKRNVPLVSQSVHKQNRADCLQHHQEHSDPQQPGQGRCQAIGEGPQRLHSLDNSESPGNPEYTKDSQRREADGSERKLHNPGSHYQEITNVPEATEERNDPSCHDTKSNLDAEQRNESQISQSQGLFVLVVLLR